MRRMRYWAMGAFWVASFAAGLSDESFAGVFGFGRDKKDCCTESCPQCPPECCKPRRHCCLVPPDAPEGEVGFAIPGVVRPGQAVPVSESTLRRAVREAAVRDFKQSPESGAVLKSPDERLDDLERDMKQVKVLMEKLAVAVDKLADNQQVPSRVTK